MSLALITLPTNKSISTVSDHVRKIGQGEKGQKLDVIVTDANGSGYDLTNKKITFSENKEGGKIVSDNEAAHFNITDEKAGRFTYTLARQVYAASGIAWFDIGNEDGSVVDTTKNFNITVIEDETIQINNDNYVSSMQALETHYRAVIQKTEQDNADLTARLNDKIDKAIADGDSKQAAALEEAKAKIQALADTLQGFKEEWNAQFSKQKQSIQDAADSQLTDKLAGIQSDYDNWKNSTVTDFQKQLDKLAAELKDNEKNQADLKTAIDSAMQAVKKIKDVDFTQFAHKEDLNNFYDKTTIDEKLDKAGKLKQISVNGGTPVGPDEKGVANIDIDSIDFNKYETKEDAEILEKEISKRPLTVNNISPDDKGNISIAIPDVSKMQQDITTLQNEMEEQKSKVTYHYADTLADGQKYSTANPQILTGTP